MPARIDIYEYYTRLEPHHDIFVDEEGFQWVICPFKIDEAGNVTLHPEPVEATISWAPTAGPDEVECPRCEVFKGELQLAGPPAHDHQGEAEIEDDPPPIMGGAHGGQHHVSEYQACKIPNRRFELVRGVYITAHEGVVASCGRFRARYEAANGYARYPIRQSVTGAYVCRKTTSGSSWSKHAYGCAIDINWDKNPYGKKLVTDMPKWFVDIWISEGWGWGGNWKSVKDAMHMSKFPNEGGDGKLYVGGSTPPKPQPKEDDMIFTYYIDGHKYATDGLYRQHIDGPAADQWYSRLEGEGNIKYLGVFDQDTNGRAFHDNLINGDELKHVLFDVHNRIKEGGGGTVDLDKLAVKVANELHRRLEK